MSSLRIFLLGSPRVELDGQAVELDRRKAIALIAYLAVTDRTHSRDALATLLWPEFDQTRARAALRRTLSVINKALAGQHLVADRATIALQPGAGLWTDLSQFQQHVIEYREHAPQADEAGPDSLALLTEAVALYRGDFMAGFTLRDSPGFDEWQFFETERLRRELAGALALLSAGYRALDDYELALSYARRQLELDPLNEATHRALMELYALTDQRPAALRQYRECARILDQELGIAPAEPTTTLFERIRVGKLAGPTGAHTSPVSQNPTDIRFQTDGDLPASLRPVSSPPSSVSSGTQVAGEGRPPFVAREQELAQLTGYLEKIMSGRGQVILITGDAGSGKTALIHEFARRAQQAVVDLIAASGSCNSYTGLGDPYLPFREILALLTGDVESGWRRGAVGRENAARLRSLVPVSAQVLLEDGPDLIDSFVSASALAARVAAAESDQTVDLPRLRQLQHGQLGRPEVHDGRSLSHDAPSHLLEQFTDVLQTLAQHKPLLLAIDDAQWADAASLELLFLLSRRLRQSRVLLLITYRPDDLAVERPQPGSNDARSGDSSRRHPLEPLVNEIRRIYGEIRIDLDQVMDRQFVDSLIDIEPNQLGQEFRTALFQRTQGHPLFTVELLREMQARHDIVRDQQGRWTEGPALDWDTLPARVEAVIDERISRLDDELRQILTLASVEGKTFTVQLIATIQGLDQHQLFRTLAQELDKRHRLVVEQGEIQVGAHYLLEYQFAHTLFQQYLYNSLSAGERRMRHRDVALALEDLYQGHTDQITVQLAHHFAEAGQIEQAVAYLLQAGDKARGLYAHDEAAGFYQRALVFLKERGDYERAARTLMKLGLTHHLALNFRQARQAYAEGFSLWQRAGMNRPTALLAAADAPHPLRLVWSSPPTLDPTLAFDDSSSGIIRQLFSGLVLLNQELDVVPEVAHSWEVLEGGRSYVFHLRTDVTWSDGQPVTAGDFVFALRRVLDPAIGSPNASYFYDIEGARAYHRGEATVPAAIGVRALDPATLVVNLEGPTGHFPQLLAQCYPVPQHVVETYGQAWTTADRIVTNGPFELRQWQPGALMTFERSARYRGRYDGNVRQVELSLNVGSRAELVQMYETDRLDIVHLFATPEEDWLRQRHAEEYFSGPVLHTQYVAFNVRETPFMDARVRRAFALAIDQEVLTNVTQFGYQFPALGGFVPPGMPGHSAQIGLPFDPSRARQLLAEAGYPAGRGFPNLRGLIIVAHELEGAYLRDQWLDVLGITVEWQLTAWDQFLAELDKSPPHLYRIGWGIDYPDPDNPLRVGVSNIERVMGWHNKDYLRLVEEARRTSDQNARLRLYQQADKMLVEEAAILPLSYGRQHVLVKPWVRRYSYLATNWQSWKDIVIEPH